MQHFHFLRQLIRGNMTEAAYKPNNALDIVLRSDNNPMLSDSATTKGKLRKTKTSSRYPSLF